MYREFIDHLFANGELSAALDTRIYSARLPAKPVYPCMLVERVSGGEGVSHSGATGIRRARMRMSVYDKCFGDANALLETARAYLHGARAVSGAVEFGGFDCSEGPPVYDADLPLWLETVDVNLQWKRN